MTTIESLNSSIKIYLSSSTTRYLELGEFGSSSQMLNELEYEDIDNFIEHELIYKIGYCWTYNIHDIGAWRYSNMFSIMFRNITNNETLITYMTDFINTERLEMGRSANTTVYSPIDVLRNYAFYYARTLDKNFFRQIIEEHFRQDTCGQPVPRNPYESDSDTESEPDDEPETTKPNRTPPPA